VTDARILLVEDNELNRSLVRAIISRTTEPRLRGANLAEAETVAEAQEMLASGGFDVVLLDVHLPDGSGLAVARDLAARPDRPAVVALTAAAMAREEAAAMDAGCDTFLAKPYTSADLVRTIVDLLPE
jgi:two-component system, OmpR family, KDP operon response regulator KdpE